MNYSIRREGLKLLGLFFTVISTLQMLHADTSRVQSFNLHAGWNAIYLPVAPTNSDPAVVFSNLPVSIAAAFFGNGSPVQFIQNPGGISWKRDGWSVWYAGSRPDAFLSTLSAINGNQAYLIYADQDFIWNVRGEVTLPAAKWKPDSYNFSGFGVNAASPPTFARYFAGSTAHQPGKIYRLVNNQWTLIANTTNTTMAAGEACWVYCHGASDYQGPLTVKPSAGSSVSFGSTGEAPVYLENRTADPLTVTVETVDPAGSVPLGYVVRAVTDGKAGNNTFDLPAQYTPPTLEAKDNSWLWLKLRREKMTSASQSSLLKISTDSGAEVWLPVAGTLVP